MHTCTHTPTRTHPHTQFSHKIWYLGHYAVEADAAATRDVVATVLGYPLNFKKPRKPTGQRAMGADHAVADAVKAANALVLSKSFTVGGVWQPNRQNRILTTTPHHAPTTPS